MISFDLCEAVNTVDFENFCDACSCFGVIEHEDNFFCGIFLNGDHIFCEFFVDVASGFSVCEEVVAVFCVYGVLPVVLFW